MLLFHRTACEGADDVLVELIDYCYRKFSNMLAKCERLADGEYLRPDESSKPAKDIIKQTKSEEMAEQVTDVEFKCTIACFSIIRFISD